MSIFEKSVGGSLGEAANKANESKLKELLEVAKSSDPKIRYSISDNDKCIYWNLIEENISADFVKDITTVFNQVKKLKDYATKIMSENFNLNDSKTILNNILELDGGQGREVVEKDNESYNVILIDFKKNLVLSHNKTETIESARVSVKEIDTTKETIEKFSSKFGADISRDNLISFVEALIKYNETTLGQVIKTIEDIKSLSIDKTVEQFCNKLDEKIKQKPSKEDKENIKEKQDNVKIIKMVSEITSKIVIKLVNMVNPKILGSTISDLEKDINKHTEKEKK